MSGALRKPALSASVKAEIVEGAELEQEFEDGEVQDESVFQRSTTKAVQVTAGKHNEPFTISPLLEIDREVDDVLSPSRKTVVERSVRFSYAFESKRGSVPLNPRRANHDAHVEVYPFAQTAGCALFAVCDGHGFEGARISRFAAKHLPNELEKELVTGKRQQSVGDALTSAFMKTNVQLYESEIDVSFSGAVVVACVLDGCDLWIANAGNARAVLGRKSRNKSGRVGLRMVELSIDHTPRRYDECQRIIRRGGRVEPFKTVEGVAIGPPRVWLSHQDAPGLQVTRAIGNSVAATVGIVAEPEVIRKRLDDNDKIIIIATDGLWEFFSSREALKVAASCASAEDAAALLLQGARRRWEEAEETGVVDDITVVVVFLDCDTVVRRQ